MASDSLRKVLTEVFTRPDYQWVERRQPLLWLANLWRRLLDWLDRLAEQHPVGYNLLFAAAVVLLVLLLVHIAFVLWRIVHSSARARAAIEDGSGGPVVHDAAAHLARAAELARAGRYAEALGHRFLALVLALEGADVLRFHASKTPAEYVGEARLDDERRTTLAGMVVRLYRHVFGAVPCGAAEYDAFGADARSLEGHVVPA